MNERRRLEATLASLPDAIDWPEPSPQLSSRITARIEPGSARRRPRTLRWALALAVAVIVVLTISAFPAARQAVADLFSEAGVRIGFINEQPEVRGQTPGLGEQVSLDDAAVRVGIELRVPVGTLGPPDAVYVEQGRTVSMQWSNSQVLLSQSPSGDLVAQKEVGPETLVTEVDLAGTPALWIEGARHSFSLLDDQGNRKDLTTRLVANVLLWTAQGVDHRLELTGDLDQALEVAESMKASE